MIKRAVFSQQGQARKEEPEEAREARADGVVEPQEFERDYERIEGEEIGGELPPAYSETTGVPAPVIVAPTPHIATGARSAGATTPSTRSPPPLPPRRTSSRPIHTRQSPSVSSITSVKSESSVSSADPSSSASASRPTSPNSSWKKAVNTKDRLLLSANLVLTTVDDSARRVWDASSAQLEAVVGHKFGADAAANTHLATQTARNVVLVYVDMKGVARRALFQKAGKEFAKARVAGIGSGNGGSKSASATPATGTPATASPATSAASSRPTTPPDATTTGREPRAYAEYKRNRSRSRDIKKWESPIPVSYAVRGEALSSKV